jgi:DNA-binding PadR family transcriptional regulator
MYRSRDSETTRSSLEVFILTLIRQGFMTTYDLQSGAGLSLGATVPALNRLSDAKLVSRRIVVRRHEYALTRGGEQVLRDWEPPVGRAATDYEDLLRTAYLSAYLFRKPAVGAEILRQAARARSSSGRRPRGRPTWNDRQRQITRCRRLSMDETCIGATPPAG